MEGVRLTVINDLMCTIESASTTIEEQLKYLQLAGYQLHKITVKGHSNCKYRHQLEGLMDLPSKVYSYLKQNEQIFNGSELLDVKSFCKLDGHSGNSMNFEVILFIETYDC